MSVCLLPPCVSARDSSSDCVYHEGQTDSLRWQVVTHSGVAAVAHCPLSFSEGVTDVSPPPPKILLLC